MKKRLLSLALAMALMAPAMTTAASAAETATRRDLAEALYDQAGKPAFTQTVEYYDLKAGDTALYWISEAGLMTGYGGKTMAPDQAVTREQLATVLYRYAKDFNLVLTERDAVDPTAAEWAQDALAWAGANGVLKGINDDSTITPAELTKAMENLKKVAIDPAAEDLNAILTDPGVTGYAVMAFKDGKLAYQRTGGDRFLDPTEAAKNLPMEMDTRFRTASISKTFATIGAMRLVEQGKLDLDADVSDYLGFQLRNPNYPDKVITTRMLLSHSSSIQDGSVYTIAPEYSIKEFFTPEGKYWNGGEHFENSADGVDRSPGNWMHYSNLGFGVVGTIIERISGQRFDVYMKENVLEPTGLKASYNPGHFTADEIKDMAVLYQVLEENGPLVAQIDDYRGQVQDPNKVLITNPELQDEITLVSMENYEIGTNATLFSPQGGLRISAEETQVLIEMFLNDGKVGDKQILTKESVDEMFKAQFSYDPAKENANTYAGLLNYYGLGIWHMSGEYPGDSLVKDRKIYLAGHFGEAYGLLAGFFIDRETGDGIYYCMTGQTAPDFLNYGEYSGMYTWEEAFCTALLDNLFPEL